MVEVILCNICKRIEKPRAETVKNVYSFAARAIDSWNQLPGDILCARNVYKFTEACNNVALGDGVLLASLQTFI